MDTNKQTNQHIQLNTFQRGMNADSSYDQVSAGQYIFGQNIRITNNTLILDSIDSNTTEGIVTPVACGKPVTLTNITGVEKILATASIGNVGVVIIATAANWEVYKLIYENNAIKTHRLLTSSEKAERDRFSVILNEELEGVTKLYIADGKHPIMQLNIDNGEIKYNKGVYQVEDKITSNRMFPTNQVGIKKQISGTLKTSQIQYTYRLYQKYGISSKLAPLTSKIQVIDNNRNKETGNAENTQTSIGFKLGINVTGEFAEVFDHIQLFRLSYIKQHESPEINLIYDAKFDGTELEINDNGFTPLKQYSVDEFAALESQTVIPQSIEHNQGYMFAANIKDETVFQPEIDAKDIQTYQCNNEDEYILYSDSTYSEDSKKRFQTITDITSEFKYNKYNDINLGAEDEDQCKFINDVLSGAKYLGGLGKIVQWKFVTTKIGLDSTVSDKEFYYYKYFEDEGVQLTNAAADKTYYTKSKNVYISGFTYNDIVGSSLFRSLRRGEVYRYGIVFYDKYGKRSDVYHIQDIRVPSLKECNLFQKGEDGQPYAFPIGIEFTVHDLPQNVVGYEIVRSEICPEYSSILTQCAISRPVLQQNFKDDSESQTSFYNSGFLTTNEIAIQLGFGNCRHTQNTLKTKPESRYAWLWPINSNDYCRLLHDSAYRQFVQNQVYYSSAFVGRFDLLQIFNSEVNMDSDTTLSNLTTNGLKLSAQLFIYGDTIDEDNKKLVADHEKNDYYTISRIYNTSDKTHSDYDGSFHIMPYFAFKNQSESSNVFNYYSYTTDIKFDINGITTSAVDILKAKDAKQSTWEQGITNVQVSGDQILSAVDNYKQYITAIDDCIYTNWTMMGRYDAPVCENEADGTIFDKKYALLINKNSTAFDNSSSNKVFDRTVIGPGPKCLLLKTSQVFLPTTEWHYPEHMGTYLCNITHNASQFNGLLDSQKQYETYYGFGNYSSVQNKSNIVFDGNIYITPCEITTMYKTFDFNDQDNLPSRQIIYNIIMESPINNYFDYGMNYRNTTNQVIQSQPGSIEGIANQERPQHQYNMIYSDNNVSNNVFQAKLLEDKVSNFKQRIVYSEHKTNGENIDSWTTFKPADFIDADSKYGEITNLYTSRDIIYYWQDQAFGKLSVNERSLVKDQNSNSIQLGQGTVLQRTDYLDTKYGMRKDDYCAIQATGGIYWIDINNKAVVAYGEGGAVNLTEYGNVQNIVNENISEDRPCISYDVQNDELLCNFLSIGQIVYNPKFKIMTSVYNRKYTDTIDFKNTLFGLNIDENNKITTSKLNNLKCDDGPTLQSPEVLEFVVNENAYVTKVFDSQSVVTLKRENIDNYFSFVTNTYVTDLNDSSTKSTSSCISDREHNIQYPIERSGNSNYGDRIRGKWMKVKFEIQPKSDFAISQVLTKYRVSFS